MSDASFELQVAIVALLKNDPTLTALIGGRVYDHVPRDPATNKVTATFPYVSLGPDQELPEAADCVRATEFVLQLDAWSREPGFPEVKKVARAVEDALHDVEFPLPGNAMVYFEYDGRRVFRDPDGLTSQAAMTFRAGIDKA